MSVVGERKDESTIAAAFVLVQNHRDIPPLQSQNWDSQHLARIFLFLSGCSALTSRKTFHLGATSGRALLSSHGHVWTGGVLPLWEALSPSLGVGLDKA